MDAHLNSHHQNLEQLSTQKTNGAMPSTTTPDQSPFIKDWAPALRALRASRSACAERLKSITEKCAASHGKAHALECDECYGSIVDEIRGRYLGTNGGDEWFSGREAFLKELGGLLDGARERRVTLGEVDERIRREKKAWYRDVLRSEPYYAHAAVASVGYATAFNRVLDVDEDGGVAQMVREGVGPVRGGAIDPETYLSLLDSADSKRDDLLRLIFETDDGKIPDGVEPHADLYRTGTPITAVLSTINDESAPPSSDLYARARGAQEERWSRRDEARSARERLDELERARAAHTKIVSKKTEEKDKSLRPEFYSLPACRGCGGEVQGGKVVACSLCQVGVEMGAADAQTVYCSMTCCEKAHNSHVEDSHSCTSGAACLRRTPSPPAPSTALCKECVANHKSTPYCSPTCAATTLKSHLQEAHPSLPKEAGEVGAGLPDVGKFVVGLGEVHSERIGKKVKGAEFVEL